MLIPKNPRDIGPLGDYIIQMTAAGLDIWLNRLTPDFTGGWPRMAPDHADLVVRHRGRLYQLIRQATPWPQTVNRAIQLALKVDPVLRGRGYYEEWVVFARDLVVAVYGNHDPEDDLDQILVAAMWQAVGRCYAGLSDDSRAAVCFKMAIESVPTGTEAGLDLLTELRTQKAGLRARQQYFVEADLVADELVHRQFDVRDIYTEAHGRTLRAYNHLQVYQLKDSFVEAQQAFILWHYLDNDLEQTRVLQYMAEALRLNNRFQRADAYLNMAAERPSIQQKESWYANLQAARGNLAQSAHRLDDAVAYLEEAVSIYMRIGDQYNTLSCRHALGLLYTKTGQYAQAEALLKQALEAWRNADRHFEIANTLWGLAEVYVLTGRYVEARDHLRQALQQVRLRPPGEYRDNLVWELVEALRDLPPTEYPDGEYPGEAA